MTENKDIFFELSDAGNLVRIEPIELINYNSDIDWDKNWVRTKITVKGGKFSGQYVAEIMTLNFDKFKNELSDLYDSLSGRANFGDIEGYLKLNIVGDGFGHFDVDVLAVDEPGINGSQLKFSMTFDQTIIKELVKQLNLITKNYPIIGNLNK